MKALIFVVIATALAYSAYRNDKSLGSRCGYFAGRRDGQRQS